MLSTLDQLVASNLSIRLITIYIKNNSKLYTKIGSFFTVKLGYQVS
ncbi:MAG: hypothetical protein O7C58_01670 [Rickettsia endosymbiont of Ixodes persulcatus]|nr:hypothetical protein [Rickettsia endosymbiont of Ixodes persulcatus]MCZ6910862.1 hypothetical protein [Rickettsia endosymbiont of Ixodes persulcatus]MCZ6919329.1 hypothetical protein [Rickettsia endosymbiont of Ixodes persulcatus]MCZ6925207.1 hypothetical protein [Rickettsia endosymbiont of Ixodes persulcatus]